MHCTRVCVCVCVCVCVDEITFHAPASNSAYQKYMTKRRFLMCGFLPKTYGSKVIVKNTFQDAFVERCGRASRHGAYQQLDMTA